MKKAKHRRSTKTRRRPKLTAHEALQQRELAWGLGLGVLFAILVVSSGCDMKRIVPRSLNSSGYQIVASDQGTVGIRNFAQIRESMSEVTGVPVSDTDVTNYYNANRARFSLDGNVESVTPSMLLAISSMAGIYCGKFVAAEQALAATQRKAFTSVDFARNQAQFTSTVASDVATRLARIFWRRMPSAVEIAAVQEVLDESKTRANSTNETRNALIAACAAQLSARDFIRS